MNWKRPQDELPTGKEKNMLLIRVEYQNRFWGYQQAYYSIEDKEFEDTADDNSRYKEYVKGIWQNGVEGYGDRLILTHWCEIEEPA